MNICDRCCSHEDVRVGWLKLDHVDREKRVERHLRLCKACLAKLCNEWEALWQGLEKEVNLSTTAPLARIVIEVPKYVVPDDCPTRHVQVALGSVPWLEGIALDRIRIEW